MKKKLFVFLICCLVGFLLVGCQKKEEKLKESTTKISEVENVSAEIVDISPTGATIIL